MSESPATASRAVPVFATPSPEIRLVPHDRPWLWLQRGWADMAAAPRVSLAYGGIVVGLSLALAAALLGTGLFYLLLPLAGGFMLLAPLLAVGLYETSRRLAAGEPADLTAVRAAWRRNGGQIGLLAVALLLLHFTWVRVAMLLYALFFNGVNPTLDNLVHVVFNSPVSLPFLVTGTLLGAVLALAAFALSAVSIPMLLDREEANAFTAIATSVTALKVNPRAMALWAGIIVFFTAVGMATLFAGLAVAMPLIGHATWHAYRDLVRHP
ncbi:MAG TPA: DUF2189 domain-containing protein [Azospirillaceae bacterium]|nr:DUF2189 domain-containing protein [Azospirillaceae bacterium]